MKFAVFDVDGTLVDSAELIVGAMESACAAMGETFVGAPALLATVGLPLVRSVPELFPHMRPTGHSELISAYSEAYRALRMASDSPERLFDGVEAGLEELHQDDWILGVATGKSSNGLAATLAKFELRHYFTTLHTADDGPGKPDPHMLKEAMAAVGAAASDTIMIGDTTFDIQMACRAGCRAIGVTWGHHPPGELRTAGADAVVGTFAELIAALQR